MSTSISDALRDAGNSSIFSPQRLTELRQMGALLPLHGLRSRIHRRRWPTKTARPAKKFVATSMESSIEEVKSAFKATYVKWGAPQLE
jgi:hypothetical protein